MLRPGRPNGTANHNALAPDHDSTLSGEAKMRTAESEEEKIGKWSAKDFKEAEDSLNNLKTFHDRILKELSQPAEFFEPDYKLDHESRKDAVRKIKFFNQTAFAHSLFLRHGLALKLLSVIDGYISAVDHKNVVLVYLSARYALELLATVNFISDELKTAKAVELRDWQGRGTKFLLTLCRARHSSSDPKIAALMKSGGVSDSAIKPIRIGSAIKHLAQNENFKSAVHDYDFLSNVCHHNGTSHHLFHKSLRMTDMVRLPGGEFIKRASPGWAITLEYPPRQAYRAAVVQTARLVLSCAAWIDTMLQEFPLIPFSDRDCSTVTKGALTKSLDYRPFRKSNVHPKQTDIASRRPGRNDPCPCGSGKKFKHCCLHKTGDELPPVRLPGLGKN
jgi:hypothetical protein